MASDFSRANNQRLESMNLTFLSVQLIQADLTLFNAWLDASQSGDSQRTAYIEHLFSDKLRTAFEAWQALRNTPSEATQGLTPFDMPEYQATANETIETLNQQAETYFTSALAANQTSDNYVLNTLLLALALFLTGVSDGFGRIGFRITMRLLTIVILMIALVTIISYPTL